MEKVPNVDMSLNINVKETEQPFCTQFINFDWIGQHGVFIRPKIQRSAKAFFFCATRK